MDSQKPDQESSDFGTNADIREIKPQVSRNAPPESQAEESKVEDVEQPVAAEAKSPPEEEVVEHQNTISAAQVEDSVEINNEKALEKQPV